MRVSRKYKLHHIRRYRLVWPRTLGFHPSNRGFKSPYRHHIYSPEEKQQTRHSVTVEIAGAAPVRTANALKRA